MFVDYEHINQEIAEDVYIIAKHVHANDLPPGLLNAQAVAKRLFDFIHDGTIAWTDNVPHALALNIKAQDLPQRPSVMDYFYVTLGAPDGVEFGSDFCIVSRLTRRKTQRGSEPRAEEIRAEKMRFQDHFEYLKVFKSGKDYVLNLPDGQD